MQIFHAWPVYNALTLPRTGWTEGMLCEAHAAVGPLAAGADAHPGCVLVPHHVQVGGRVYGWVCGLGLLV